MAISPVHARFQAYLDSNKWKSDIPEFIKTYRLFLKTRNGYISATYIAPADVLLEKARALFKGLKAKGHSIPDDILGDSPANNNAEANVAISPTTLAAIAAAEEAEALAVPRLSPPRPATPVLSNYNNENNNNNNNNENNNNANSAVSPGTLAAIAAAEEAEALGALSPPAIAISNNNNENNENNNENNNNENNNNENDEEAEALAALALPSLTKKSPPVRSKRLAAPAPAPLVAVPREGAIVGAIPGIVPASCGQMTPEFIEQWVADNYSHLPQGDPYGSRDLVIHPAFNSEFEIKRTVGDGTCLLHSFLTDISPTYRGMTERAKEVVGAAFRKHIYAMLYPPDERMKIQRADYVRYYRTPSIDAKTIKRANKKRIGNDFEDELYDALAQAYIRDTLGYLYDDDIQKLRDCFNIRIIIVTQNDVSHDIFRLGPVSPEELAAEFEREQEANVENGYTRYIMIFQEGAHFEAVRRQGTDQYIFIYPEVQAIIEASRGVGINARRGLKTLFVPGTPVTVQTEDGEYVDLIVGEDGVHYEDRGNDLPLVDQVYLEPADHSVAPQLYPIGDIMTVNGRGFRAADYQAAPSPGVLSGKHGSLASTSAPPKLSPYREQFPPLRVVVSAKRKGKSKGTKRRLPSLPKPQRVTWRRRKTASAAIKTAKLAKAKLAAVVAAFKRASRKHKPASP
jgi:hypothetical protein